MRYLDAADLRNSLPMVAAIEAMVEAFAGDVEFPPRMLLGGSLFMPGRMGGISGVKVVSIVPGAPAGIVAVFAEDGAPLGLVDGPTLTAIRTAAGAGLATRLLAPQGATVMAMLGAGAMAVDQIEAIRTVRAITEVRVWSRSPERAAALAARVDAVAVANPSKAVDGADVVTSATPATVPLFVPEAVSPNVHINAVGAFTPEMVEIPPALVRRSWVVVDDTAAAAAEAGDLIRAGKTPDATVKDLVSGDRPAHRPTLFKSVGIASQDVAAAAAALERAERHGYGVMLG
ncbi:MAG: ornithine cyclodeaminase family protein [Acidimicrobiia bacterium]